MVQSVHVSYTLITQTHLSALEWFKVSVFLTTLIKQTHLSALEWFKVSVFVL